MMFYEVNVLMLLVGWQERHPACRSSATTISKSLVLGMGLTWSNQTWSNSGKMSQLNRNQVWWDSSHDELYAT